MIEGILIHKSDGTWVVKSELHANTSSGMSNEIPLHPDTLYEFSPNLSNITTWNGNKVKFELVKKFLANETLYLAKVKQEKIVLSWAAVIQEYAEFNYGVEEDVLRFYDWLKDNFKSPTKR